MRHLFSDLLARQDHSDLGTEGAEPDDPSGRPGQDARDGVVVSRRRGFVTALETGRGGSSSDTAGCSLAADG